MNLMTDAIAKPAGSAPASGAANDDSALPGDGKPTHLPQLSLARKLRHKLELQGFAAWSGEEMVAALPATTDYTAVIQAGRAAPPDPEDNDGNRYRCFGAIHFYPWAPESGFTVVAPFTDSVTRRSYARYSQPVNINPEAGGRTRRFAPLPALLWHVLWPLVDLLFQATPEELVSHGDPVACHIHLVSMRPRGNWAAYSVPNLLHQDSDPVTYVVLTERSENAGGGQSIIGTARAARREANWQDIPDREIIQRLTLTEPWSGVGVWDSRVSHAVTPVYGVDGEPANRTALLIDFANVPI